MPPLPLANVLQPLIDPFEAVLKFFHDTVGFGWGFSIVALTMLIRALLLPLTIKQFKSMRSLQVLTPEIKKLQERYKDDKQRLNQEMMKFYSENKVNPFGSCLPILLQLPVFLALFYMLQDDLRVEICGDVPGFDRDEPCGTPAAEFLFIPDITDSATGGVLIALILLYIGSQLVSSLLMSVSADRNQRLILLALPFVFVIFIIRFPAGLIVYWITTNVWTIGQQFIVRRLLGPPPDMKTAMKEANEEIEAMRARKGKGGGGKPAVAGAAATGGTAAPPPPPRKKKKRSGRRR